MRGTMSLRKKIAILTMASMTVWGVTALLPFNQGGAGGNCGYGRGNHAGKTRSRWIIRHQAVRLPKQREIYTMLSLIQPIHGGATQGKSLLLIAAALEPQRHLLRYTDRS